VTPPPRTSSIPTDELIKLKELMDAGILTQEEFDRKKKQLLGI
ncbi:SHOCT domain-containing protein, partial [Bacillus paralicheniformis]